MIDSDGYRFNIGIIIINDQGKLLWARRAGQNSWQFPQGGLHQDESPEQALYRELEEEIGLESTDVEILGVTKDWLHYKLPERFIRYGSEPLCIGQKQKWYLLRLKSSDDRVILNKTGKPEFDSWRWVSYWYPRHKIIGFKRDVYRAVLKEFASIVFPAKNN